MIMTGFFIIAVITVAGGQKPLLQRAERLCKSPIDGILARTAAVRCRRCSSGDD